MWRSVAAREFLVGDDFLPLYSGDIDAFFLAWLSQEVNYA